VFGSFVCLFWLGERFWNAVVEGFQFRALNASVPGTLRRLCVQISIGGGRIGPSFFFSSFFGLAFSRRLIPFSLVRVYACMRLGVLFALLCAFWFHNVDKNSRVLIFPDRTTLLSEVRRMCSFVFTQRRFMLLGMWECLGVEVRIREFFFNSIEGCVCNVLSCRILLHYASRATVQEAAS